MLVHSSLKGCQKLNRNQLNILDYWLKKPNRKPLVIRGARQVGKSTLTQLFASRQQRSLAEVNLERYPELAITFTLKKSRAYSAYL